MVGCRFIDGRVIKIHMSNLASVLCSHLTINRLILTNAKKFRFSILANRFVAVVAVVVVVALVAVVIGWWANELLRLLAAR